MRLTLRSGPRQDGGRAFRFNRLEWAVYFGDLRTIMPLAIGMILINGLNPVGLFAAVGLFYLATGLLLGILFVTHEGSVGLRPGIILPALMPYGEPILDAFTFALLVLVLPQIPMSLGNAVMATADLSHQYFSESGHRVNYRSLCLSMSLANLVSFLVGGTPMCHGAGGLASRYRFGARTGGSNMIIGALFPILALVFGEHLMGIVHLLPMSVLGMLLVFAGTQLGLTLLDMQTRKDLSIPLLVVGITHATNLATGFIVGIVVVHPLKWPRLSV